MCPEAAPVATGLLGWRPCWVQLGEVDQLLASHKRESGAEYGLHQQHGFNIDKLHSKHKQVLR